MQDVAIRMDIKYSTELTSNATLIFRFAAFVLYFFRF